MVETEQAMSTVTIVRVFWRDAESRSAEILPGRSRAMRQHEADTVPQRDHTQWSRCLNGGMGGDDLTCGKPPNGLALAIPWQRRGSPRKDIQYHLAFVSAEGRRCKGLSGRTA